MNIKKEYEKFFERKKNDLCVHNAEDVIEFTKHYQALQLQQTGVVRCCTDCNHKLIIHCDDRQYCPNMKCSKDFQ